MIEWIEVTGPTRIVTEAYDSENEPILVPFPCGVESRILAARLTCRPSSLWTAVARPNSSPMSVGGVPTRILYDDTKIEVAKVLGGSELQRTRAFSGLQSHYLFADKFGRPDRSKRNQSKHSRPVFRTLLSRSSSSVGQRSWVWTDGSDKGPITVPCCSQ